ncbi:sperm acrosome membrane-associated protein 4-like [Amia ocellicauda]|uniref:sperm acrosome membrane-associated protein 4-like n=1 Tax=Amia ocellicauda TaxID=2972642 RepID=UPI0034644920
MKDKTKDTQRVKKERKTPSPMSHFGLLLLTLSLLYSGGQCLRCYTCVFPAISPLDCIKFPQKCPPGQRCLSSKAIGTRGDFRVVFYEKSCVVAELCGATGEKQAMGLNFTFTNTCCDEDLCNAAAPRWPPPAPALGLALALTLAAQGL